MHGWPQEGEMDTSCFNDGIDLILHVSHLVQDEGGVDADELRDRGRIPVCPHGANPLIKWGSHPNMALAPLEGQSTLATTEGRV